MRIKYVSLIIFAPTAFIILLISNFSWCFGNEIFMDAQNKNDHLAATLKHHVYKLSQEIGDRSVFNYEKLVEAKEYITDQLISFGYTLEFQNYTLNDREVKNIIATKIGQAKPQEIIILGAHYDSCFNPGADDNASAVAGLLEIARLLSDKPTNRSIKFIAFVNEEPPFFKTDEMGSRVYVKEAKKQNQDIKAVIIFEMIGYYSDKANSQKYPPIFGLFYPHKANFIAVVGNFRSRWLVRKIIADFKNYTRFPIEGVSTFGFVPGVDFSDHWSFWKQGYPAVMITDTAFYRYSHYHSQTDTYEKLNYESLSEVVKGFEAVLRQLTN